MSKDNNSNYSTSWGLILSVILHGIIMILIVVWGVRKYTDTDYSKSIEVSLSDLQTGSYGSGQNTGKPSGATKEDRTSTEKKGDVADNKEKVAARGKKVENIPEKKEEKKPEVKEKEEPKKALFKQELKPVEKKEPKKQEPEVEKKPEKKEPAPVKKAEKEPEVKEKKTEKIPLETVPKKEPEKKTEKKEVKKQPEPEKKTKKEEVAKSEQKNTESETNKDESVRKTEQEEAENENSTARKNVLNELKRKNIISSLRPATNTEETTTGSEAQSNEGSGSGGSEGAGSGGRSSGPVNPTILKLFQQSISKKIKERFKIPPNIPKDGSLSTEISFKIDKYGNVSSVKIEKSSGNPSFDKYCVNAVYSSSPFPSPPGELVELSQSEGFIIDMNNEG